MYIGKRDWNEEDDKVLAVKIFTKAVLNKFKSEQQQKQVFDDREYISIMAPGQKNQITERPMTDKDKERFKVHYENWKQRNENVVNGIPLEMLPGITPAQVANLKALKVDTIEQLAKLQERAIKNLFEGRDLVKRAVKFLEGEGYAKKLEEEINILKAEIEKLKGGGNEPVNNNSKRNKRNTTG